MMSTYIATGKVASAAASPWSLLLLPMVLSETLYLSMKQTNRRGRTRAAARSRADTLPENLIACLLVQDLDRRGFRGLLSRTTMHTVVGMGKTRGRRYKRN
jgi:hypothetical protein